MTVNLSVLANEKLLMRYDELLFHILIRLATASCMAIVDVIPLPF